LNIFKGKILYFEEKSPEKTYPPALGEKLAGGSDIMYFQGK